MLKKIIKKIIGPRVLSFYHWSLAKVATLYYGNPSNKIIVIGVTGTNGKTTTVNFISQYLEYLGEKTGVMSTVNFKIDDKEWLNDKKMTMLGRFQTQRLLSQMVKAGCGYVVVETSSQGIEQFRHVGINYDVVVFTNLMPEHIEAHGSFENYRAAKEKLFAHLVENKHKKIRGKKINKVIISNSDDKETERLQKYKVDKFVSYGIDKSADHQAQDIGTEGGVHFLADGFLINTNFLGRFTVYNILASLAVIKELNFDIAKASQCILSGVPGRQEWVETSQNFRIMVDYAPEPEGLKNLYKALESINKNRLIHVLGSCGGGRDKARQPILGNLAGANADIVIVTNEDPYDDDPMEIIENVAKGAVEAGKRPGHNLFKVAERRKGIATALKLAQKDDLILITGKGAEQFICGANGQMEPWDDRKVVKELLNGVKM